MSRVVHIRSGRARVCASDGFTLLDTIFVIALIGLLSAIAVPTLLRSRAAANETATLATMRVVHTGALSYALSCGAGLWPAGFTVLADPLGVNGFLPPDLTTVATPTKSGYTYTMLSRAPGNDQTGRVRLEPLPGGRTRLSFEERYHLVQAPWKWFEGPIYRFINRQNEASMRALSDWLSAHPEYRPDLA